MLPELKEAFAKVYTIALSIDAFFKDKSSVSLCRAAELTVLS